MLRLRTHVLICLGFFLGLLAVGWGGAILGSLGVAPPAGAWRWFFLGLLFFLLLGFAFSAVPVMVLLVAGAQRRPGFQGRIGGPGAAVAAPRWQKLIVYAMWALMGLGTAIAIPAAFLLGAFDEFGVDSSIDPGPSKGTLVAKPGMTVAQVRSASSLAIKGKDTGPVVSDGIVFDFLVAGTAIRFPSCRYYYITTFTHDPEHIQGMSIGTSAAKVDRPAILAMDLALRGQLAADGWLAGHEEYRTEDDQALHGGATRGPEGDMWLKDGTILDIESKRMDDPVAGEDLASAGEWIQVVSLWTHDDYPWIERFAFAPPAPETLAAPPK